ncbi:TonB-dependent receptor [Sphingobium aquiterrae]|uniref:TonB-dependent receptor n=1 Tax=Sphingobium aquiterrae TaxID=2038656 RepID=UPI0030189D56
MAVTVANAASAQQLQHRFDVEAGVLAASLRAIAQASNGQVAFNESDVRGKVAPALHGNFTVEAALAELLAGSGLSAKLGRSGIYLVEPDVTSSSVQGNSQPTESADQGADIVVTAQRRKERLRDVPVAVTALSSKVLDDQRIQSLEDVARVTPGLTVASFNYSNPTISVRGAANTFSQIGVDKPVAVVIDDVFITRVSAFSFNLFDLDSVEVLRGPQGTLFGRNVTGGAVVLRTAKPRFDGNSFAASATYGNYNDVELNGLVSGPVNDQIAVKAVVSYLRHDGFGYDRLTGQSLDNPESVNARGQLRYRPTGSIDNILSFDYSYDTNGGRALSSKAVGSDDGNRRTAELGLPQSFERRIWGISNHLDWDILGGTLTSVTAYRKSRAQETYSSTGAYYGLLTAGTQGYVTDGDDVGTFTQEVRYASPKWSLGDFVLGAFYLDQSASRQLYTKALAARTGVLTASTLADQHVDTTSYSAFLDGGINLPFNFRLTAGGRYTRDRKSGHLIRTNLLGSTGGFATGPFAATFEKFTPRVVLSWKPTENYLLYGSWTRGFTSGGFNSEATTLASATTPFKPENVTNYEIGAKAGWLDNRVSLAVAAYDQRYTDKQEFVFNTITRIGTILNASKARVKGVEVELGLRPARGLSLTGSYAHLDTRYSEFVVPGVLNNTGNPLPLSPLNKASAALSYETTISDTLKFLLNGSYTYTESFYTGATKDPNLFIKGYSLVNANIGLETTHGLRMSIWGKNLFNKDYLLTPSTSGVLSEYLGAPRTYGVTISARY